jgi:lipoyl-dependent peroxiredoxin
MGARFTRAPIRHSTICVTMPAPTVRLPSRIAKRDRSSSAIPLLSSIVSSALSGRAGAGTNPEQLFAAGHAACFLGAVKFVARGRKIAVPDDASVTAAVGIGAVAVGYGLEVELKVHLPGIDRATAQELVTGAHERCPYSNATRGNIEVRLTVV